MVGGKMKMRSGEGETGERGGEGVLERWTHAGSLLMPQRPNSLCWDHSSLC